MIKFLTFVDIECFCRGLNQHQEIIAKAKMRDDKTVFLSQSSRDEAILPLMIDLLGNHGASIMST